MSFLKRYFREPVNAITHAIGAVLALTGLIVMLYHAIQVQSTTHIVAFSIFGASMVLLYSTSFLYHSLHAKEHVLRFFQKLDHSMIYVLIAGSYTPVCLLVLEGSWKWGLLVTVWSLALSGIIKKFIWSNIPRWLSTSFYLGMGWIAVLIFPALLEKLPILFLIWIGTGGIAYTLGAVIYMR